MKKILLVTPFFYPHAGGSQQYMEEITASLVTNFQDTEVTVLCYNTDNTHPTETYRGMKVVRIPCWNILPGQFALPNYLEVASFLINHGSEFSVVYCNTRFFESSWWSPIYAKLTGKKSILTDHCAFYPKHSNPYIENLAQILDKNISKFFLKQFNVVLTTNKTTQKFLKNNFGIKSNFIYGGINTDLFYPAKKKNRRVKVLFVGRMIPSKGPQFLYRIAKQTPSTDFVFAGHGQLVDEFKQKVKRDRLKNVKVLGSVSRKEVANLMKKADILVHPSIHNEGFPNVLTEAAASGLAVIATDVGGVREIIPEGCGILLKTTELETKLKPELDKLIKSAKQRETLGKKLLSHAQKNFNWDIASKKLYKYL